MSVSQLKLVYFDILTRTKGYVNNEYRSEYMFMKNIVQKASALSLSASAFLFAVTPAFAANSSVSLCPPNSDFSALCGKNWSAPALLRFIVVLLLIAAVVLSLIFLIWGGIKWILSGGDKGKVEAARSTIIGALIGLAIAFAAFFLVNIVATLFLGGNGIGGFNLPTL
jgi:hypothetical protein